MQGILLVPFWQGWKGPRCHPCAGPEGPLMDIEALRRDTPGCEGRIHLNNAGAGLMSRQTLESVTSHLELEARIGGYEAATAANEQIEHTYDAIAQLVGAGRDEIAVIENA